MHGAEHAQDAAPAGLPEDGLHLAVELRIVKLAPAPPPETQSVLQCIAHLTWPDVGAPDVGTKKLRLRTAQPAYVESWVRWLDICTLAKSLVTCEQAPQRHRGGAAGKAAAGPHHREPLRVSHAPHGGQPLVQRVVVQSVGGVRPVHVLVHRVIQRAAAASRFLCR